MVVGIGIDVVQLKRFLILVETSDCFAKRLLTSNELNSYWKLNNNQRANFLAVHWTLKEAIYKATSHIKPLFTKLEIYKLNNQYRCEFIQNINLLLSVSYTNCHVSAICLAQQNG